MQAPLRQSNETQILSVRHMNSAPGHPLCVHHYQRRLSGDQVQYAIHKDASNSDRHHSMLIPRALPMIPDTSLRRVDVHSCDVHFQVCLFKLENMEMGRCRRVESQTDDANAIMFLGCRVRGQLEPSLGDGIADDVMEFIL